MSLWQNYAKKRSLKEGLGDEGGSPVDKFKFNKNDDDFAQDYEHIHEELFKLALGKYPQETIDFFNTLANRGDEEISTLLRKISKEKGSRLPKEPRHPSDVDAFVLPAADSAYNPEQED